MRQKRWKCPHCGASGWETGTERVSPQYDHDQPNGRKCLKSRPEKTAHDYSRVASEVIAPTVNLNGTAGPVLIRQLEDAVSALRAAETAVEETEPNGRDYQPQGPGKLGRAQAAHKRRLELLQDVRKDLEAVWENVQDQIDR